MSKDTKRPYAQMRAIADSLVERLRPACHRIEIAGSLRRQRPMVGDIEIVAIPRLDTDLFGVSLFTGDLDRLLAQWPIEMVKNGPKYKQFSFASTAGRRYTADLFLQPDPATWGVNFLLRTGAAEFSHRMVTPKWSGGWKPEGLEVRDARVWRGDEVLDTFEEEQVFELWNMDFIRPEERHGQEVKR